MHTVIDFSKGIARMPEWRMKEPADFQLLDNEHIAIVGDNASGKSTFVEMLTGRHPLMSEKSIAYDFAPYEKEFISDNIKYIRFCDCYGGDTDRGYYLQQRWNQTEISDEAATVRMKLERAFGASGGDDSGARERRGRISGLFSLDDLWDKPMLLLSSGELRKVALAEAVATLPRVLVIDNPFIGLDISAREMLAGMLGELSRTGVIQIILVLSSASDIPSFITHVVEIKGMTVGRKTAVTDYLQSGRGAAESPLPPEKREAILSLPHNEAAENIRTVVEMRKVTIRYGSRTILKDLDWTVRNGERWALTGQNGSGKSTLLSIICADNPQSYACDVTLFDTRRGSGESIWDIKRHIGYVSPEMHRAIHYDIPAINVVASGITNSFGMKAAPRDDDRAKCLFWMDILGIAGLAERRFLGLSSGEQRLVLLARAFANDPDLLILDEPMHGLDDANKALAKSVIEAFCARRGKTLIFVTHYREEFPNCIDHELHLEKR